MLSFSTEFPVSEGSSAEAFVATVKAWILASPHTQFTVADVEPLSLGGLDVVQSGNAKIELVGAVTDAETAIGFRYTVSDQDIDWVTEISYSGVAQPWVSVRTLRDSTAPITHLPPAKKPVVVMTLLDRLGGGRDGELNVGKMPRRLDNDEIELAGQIMTGESGSYLPVVYLSASFDGSSYVNDNVLARDLCGMAHVLVEPNRPFSQRLQLEVSSTNVYGGAIGIYWPEGAGRRLVFPNRSLSATERRQSIAREVRSALLNRRPLQWCSWSAAQQLSSKVSIQKLKDSGSGEVELYIKSFDEEIRSKDLQIFEAEQEIIRLKSDLRNNRTNQTTGDVRLKILSEQDYFNDEIISVVRDAAAEAISRVQPNGRREHILRAITTSNPPSQIPSDGRERLKSLLRDYRSMTKEVRDGLHALGFTITEDGKHFKLIYKSDDRYVFPCPKTSSDHRAGLNLASDIAKRIF
jgi:hypothetical protein